MNADEQPIDNMDPEVRIAHLEDLVFAISDVIDTLVLVATQSGDRKLQQLLDLSMRRAGLLGPSGSAFAEEE